jgi:ribonuclease P protein component
MRRRLRAAWGEVEALEGLDVVVAADRDSLAADYQNLVNHLRSALTRAESRL